MEGSVCRHETSIGDRMGLNIARSAL